MPIYNLAGYSENYAKLRLFHRNIVEMNQMITQQILKHLDLNQVL